MRLVEEMQVFTLFIERGLSGGRLITLSFVDRLF